MTTNRTRSLLAIPSALLLAASLAACGSASPAGPTPTVTVTKTVASTDTPQGCLDALGYMQDFVTIIVDEHDALSKAFTDASNSGDIGTMADDITAAEAASTKRVEALTPKIGDAAAACRAGK
jgi:hypothetical protein